MSKDIKGNRTGHIIRSKIVIIKGRGRYIVMIGEEARMLGRGYFIKIFIWFYQKVLNLSLMQRGPLKGFKPEKIITSFNKLLKIYCSKKWRMDLQYEKWNLKVKYDLII